VFVFADRYRRRCLLHLQLQPTSLPTTLSLKSISQFLPAIYAFSSFDFIHRTEEEEEEEEKL
jgi:hypothetical protein